MFRSIALSSIVVAASLLLSFTTIHSISAVSFTINGKPVGDDNGENCKLKGKNHDDNNPSSKKFYYMAYHASLCEIAQCVDVEECDNHVKVDWEKFQQSPAFVNADEEEQKAMTKAHAHGNGADGLVGYEFLDYVLKDKKD